MEHFLPENIDTGGRKPSIAYWCRNAADHLVVFVHGFNGAPKSTWTRYPEILTELTSNHGISADIIFYGYDGLVTRPAASAGLLRQFLIHFLVAPEETINASLFDSLEKNVRLSGHRYKKITLIAHSLGAVVVRAAILEIEALRLISPGQFNWLNDIRTIFIAPAHCGSHLAAAGWEVLSASGMGCLTIMLRIGKTAMLLSAADDLRVGSQFLKDLTDQIETRLKSGPLPPYLAAQRVAWADRDLVVVNKPFPGDPLQDVYGNHSHVSICKPRSHADAVVKIVWPFP